MAGRIALPDEEGKQSGTRVRSPGRHEFPQDEQSQRPPPYSDATGLIPAQSVFTETMTTTVTTTTQTVQTTTHFFSLPLWLRRGAAPALTAAATDDPRMSQAYVAEDGLMLRASSYNVDKELPAVPSHESAAAQPLTRRSQSSQDISNVFGRVRESDGGTTRNRKARAATTLSQNLPPQSSARSLAQAGLGIGLPHVMPLAAARSASASRPASPTRSRPRTAPRFEPRDDTAKEVRRVRSFKTLMKADTQASLSYKPANESFLSEESLTNVAPSKDSDSAEASSSSRAEAEPKVLTKRASFWNRRRVQSMRGGPPTALEDLPQRTEQSLAPALPSFQPMSPMFPDREQQSSPSLISQFNDAPFPGRLRRRHSERSSATESPRTTPFESSFPSEPPPIPRRSSNRPPPPRPSSSSASSSQTPQSSAQNQLPRGPAMSFISSPAISKFSPVDERMSRPRSMTNPNMLHRLSLGIFSAASPSTPISSPTISTNIGNDTPLTSSPRPSATLARSSMSKGVEIPKPKANEESPEVFLGRLEEAVSKAEIANILARNGDPFYSQALQAYIDRFDFKNNPLDIALRKLLMDVGLPKETQQIDRVMEAFANGYKKCNPGLFVAEDHAYILSFSLIMLHTDAFNKSNKRKMSKADYVKNTKLVGVPTEVLDYFYDNIVFAPFIFIEDPVDVNGQRGLTQDSKLRSSTSGHVTPNSNGTGLSMLGRSNKIDPYYLISRNLIDGLRVDVERHIPQRNPFSYQGTAGSWNEGELRRSFARADIISLDNAEVRRLSTMPLFSMNAGGAPGPLMSSFSIPVFAETPNSSTSLQSIIVTKVGVLNRKDDLSDGGKRATSRKWREWSLILTGSQLLFFRDTSVALNLLSLTRSAVDTEFLSAQLTYLKPEELISVKNAIAVYDSLYAKHNNVLRLVMSSGRQLFLQAESEMQRNEWIAHINYASAFKTAGIRMRSGSLTETAGSASNGSASSNTSPEEVGPYIHQLNPPRDSTGRSPPSTERASLDKHAGVQSRTRIILSKIRELESKIQTTQEQLKSEIRVVRHIAVLTPFQRSTRDRLQTSVAGLARRIRQLRLEIVQSTCYRDVLAADLAAEERQQRRSRMSLQLEDCLHSRKSSPVPRMTLSVYGDETSGNAPRQSSSRSDLSHGHADSSICESFHSALDFSTDWPVISSDSASPKPRTTNSFDAIPSSSSATEVASPGGSSLFSPVSPDKVDLPSPITQPVHVTLQRAEEEAASEEGHGHVHSHDTGEEQAEDWDKTRAGRRVSLVRLPVSFAAPPGSDEAPKE